MKFIKKIQRSNLYYRLGHCASCFFCLLSFATLDERTLLAQTACVLALFAVIIGMLKFDDKD